MGAKRRRLAKLKKERMLHPKPEQPPRKPPKKPPSEETPPKSVLPKELRDMIYESILPEQRHIVVHAHVNDAGVLKFTTSSPMPLELLRTSEETRDYLDQKIPSRVPALNVHVPIRFREDDVFCVDNFSRLVGIVTTHYNGGTMGLGRWATKAGNITNMLVGHSIFNNIRTHHCDAAGRVLTLFPNLQKLSILVFDFEKLNPEMKNIKRLHVMQYCGWDRLVPITRRGDRMGEDGTVIVNREALSELRGPDGLSGSSARIMIALISKLKECFRHFENLEKATWRTGWTMPNWEVLFLKLPESLLKLPKS